MKRVHQKCDLKHFYAKHLKRSAASGQRTHLAVRFLENIIRYFKEPMSVVDQWPQYDLFRAGCAESLQYLVAKCVRCARVGRGQHLPLARVVADLLARDAPQLWNEFLALNSENEYQHQRRIGQLLQRGDFNLDNTQSTVFSELKIREQVSTNRFRPLASITVKEESFHFSTQDLRPPSHFVLGLLSLHVLRVARHEAHAPVLFDEL